MKFWGPIFRGEVLTECKIGLPKDFFISIATISGCVYCLSNVFMFRKLGWKTAENISGSVFTSNSLVFFTWTRLCSLHSISFDLFAWVDMRILVENFIRWPFANQTQWYQMRVQTLFQSNYDFWNAFHNSLI